MPKSGQKNHLLNLRGFFRTIRDDRRISTPPSDIAMRFANCRQSHKIRLPLAAWAS
jgi:hypothetical protein